MKHATGTTAPSLPAGPIPARHRWQHAAGLAALLLVAAGIGITLAMTWRWHQLPERIQAGVPAMPAIEDRPAILQERLVAARALTQARATAIAGVIELGSLYHANGFPQEAEACWRLLHTEQPDVARWTYYLADLRRTANDYPAMAALLERTVKLAPDYAPAWLRLADYAFKTGHTAEAVRCFRRRLALVPGDPYARLGLARIDRLENRPAEARRAIAALVRDVPTFPPGQNLHAELLAAEGDEAGARHHRWLGREAGRFRDAEDPWLTTLEEWCHDPARLLVLGTLAYQVRDHDRARSLLERAVALAPDEATGYELLGDLYLKTGDAARARDTLREGILRTAPQATILLYSNLSEAYRTLQQPAEAAQAAREGLQQRGASPELYNSLAVALGDLGRIDEAIAAYRAALDGKPGDPDMLFNLGVTLLGIGRTAEGVASLRDSLASQPTFPKSLAILGTMELRAGRLAAARPYVEALFDAHPGQPEAQRLMSQWHLQAAQEAEGRRDTTAAELEYRAGLLIAPGVAELHAGLGVLLMLQGRIPEALPALEAYHRLQPGNPQSSLFLGQVYARLGRAADARRVLTEGAQLADSTGKTETAKFCREILQQL